MAICEARRKYLAYRSWESMKRRCDNPKYCGYYRYGGRGITYDPSWKDFYSFLADVGERPSKQHSLDRIDNNGNYEPKNVRWATSKEQNINTTRFNNYTNIYYSRERKKWVADIGRHSNKKRVVKRFSTIEEAQEFIDGYGD